MVNSFPTDIFRIIVKPERLEFRDNHLRDLDSRGTNRARQAFRQVNHDDAGSLRLNLLRQLLGPDCVVVWR